MSKVIVLGSNGLLGQTLTSKLLQKENYNVIPMAQGENRNPKVTDGIYQSIDINDLENLKERIENVQPEYLVNAIAMTNVDACEDNQEECKKVNTDLVKELSEICKTINSHLIHISTDFIFDGKKGDYTEVDIPQPVNYYGWSKLWAEEAIINSGVSYSILRTILVYGKVNQMKRDNIVLWLVKSLKEKNPIYLVNDQWRMPTYIGSLADACILSMEKKARGIYNISGKDQLSIYEMGVKIADYFGLDSSLISSIPTAQLMQNAKRPVKTGFNLSKAKNDLGFQPLTLEEGLTLLKI